MPFCFILLSWTDLATPMQSFELHTTSLFESADQIFKVTVFFVRASQNVYNCRVFKLQYHEVRNAKNFDRLVIAMLHNNYSRVQFTPPSCYLNYYCQ